MTRRPFLALLGLTLALTGATAVAPAQANPGAGTGTGTGSAVRLRAPGHLLDRPERGHAAWAGLSSTEKQAAATRNGTSGARLERLLDEDPTAWLGKDGHVFFADTFTEGGTEAGTEPDAEPDAEPAPSAAALETATDALQLHSLPGSNHVIYLDFDGYAKPSNSYWVTNGGMSAGAVDPFSLDATVSTAFSAAELVYIQTVWRIVAEKYAAFDVDVTTQDPGAAALSRSSASDVTYGTRAVFSDGAGARPGSCPAGSGCAGIAWVGVFDQVESGERFEPAWIYPRLSTGGTPMSAGQVANIAAHEIGHTLGLSHDRTSSVSYYGGHDDWFPIMGSSNRAVGQFNNGGYPGAVTDQTDPDSGAANPDDFDVIQKLGLPLRADDVVGTLSLGAAAAYSRTGLISTAADTDTFSVDRTCTDALTATATGIGLGQAVDLKVTVRRPDTTVAAVADPATSGSNATTPSTPVNMDATATVSSAGTGTWTVTVEGTGLAGTAGYSDYGSVGQYTLAISGCAGAPPSGSAPDTPSGFSVTPVPGSRTALAAWTPATGGPTGYELTVTGGGSSTSVNATGAAISTLIGSLTPGVNYTVSLVAKNASGASAPASTTVRIAPWAPLTGPTVRATVSGNRATLGWTPAANPGNATITSYRVRVLRGSATVIDQALGSDVQPLQTSSLSAGVYTVLVSIGYTADGTAFTRTGARAFTVAGRPGAPRIGTASAGSRGGARTAVVRWAPPTSTGPAIVTGYRVFASRIDSRNRVLSTKLSAIRPASSRSYAFRLPPGRYKFRVVAYNAVGSSGFSAWSRVVRPR